MIYISIFYFPAVQRRNDVELTSMRRSDVAFASMRRHVDVMYLLGCGRHYKISFPCDNEQLLFYEQKYNYNCIQNEGSMLLKQGRLIRSGQPHHGDETAGHASRPCHLCNVTSTSSRAT